MFASVLLLITFGVIGYRLDKLEKKLDNIIKELRIDGWSIK